MNDAAQVAYYYYQ